jgi:hypothetical protein
VLTLWRYLETATAEDIGCDVRYVAHSMKYAGFPNVFIWDFVSLILLDVHLFQMLGIQFIVN